MGGAPTQPGAVRLGGSRHALPAALPAGERVLWRGAPDWRALARRALHVRGLALYLGLVVAWVGVSAVRHGAPPGTIAFEVARAALVAAVPLALAVGYAWLAARAACYTITNKRVVIAMGLALPMTLNLPFARISGAGLVTHRDGSGDLTLELMPGSKGLGWFILWPHARPWRFAAAQPALRGLLDAAQAGQVLARALAESASLPVSVAQATGKVDTQDCHHGATTVAA